MFLMGEVALYMLQPERKCRVSIHSTTSQGFLAHQKTSPPRTSKGSQAETYFTSILGT
jgi:hypothetical protein